MTVMTTATKTGYSGDGVTVTFPVPFKFTLAADLRVYISDDTGVLYPQVLSLDYTVSGAGLATGGAVIMKAAVLVGQSIVIERSTMLLQDADYVENDGFPAETHERVLDKIVMAVQESVDGALAALRGSPLDGGERIADMPPASARAGRYLCFDGAGHPIVSDGVPGPLPLPGYLYGLELSVNISVLASQIFVAKGVATSFAGNATINIGSPQVLNFAIGGLGGLDTGIKAAKRWYHVFAISKADGVSGVIASLSSAMPLLPAGFVHYRRIGAVATDASAALIPFSQSGDYFLWWFPINDISVTNVGAVEASFTLSSPPGVRTTVMISGYVLHSVTPSVPVYMHSPDVVPMAAGGRACTAVTAPTAGAAAGFSTQIRTDDLGRIAAVSNTANTTLYLNTNGWIDTRGRI